MILISAMLTNYSRAIASSLASLALAGPLFVQETYFLKIFRLDNLHTLQDLGGSNDNQNLQRSFGTRHNPTT